MLTEIQINHKIAKNLNIQKLWTMFRPNITLKVSLKFDSNLFIAFWEEFTHADTEDGDADADDGDDDAWHRVMTKAYPPQVDKLKREP